MGYDLLNIPTENFKGKTWTFIPISDAVSPDNKDNAKIVLALQVDKVKHPKLFYLKLIFRMYSTNENVLVVEV